MRLFWLSWPQVQFTSISTQQYSILFADLISTLMNYTVLSRHSTAGPTFTDRPSDIGANMVRSKNRPSNEHHHLNPSKSKVNVRTFLNKSGDNFSLSNPNLDSVKGSGFLGNPPKAPQNVERDGYCEQKQTRMNKQGHEMAFEMASKENFPKFNFTPVSVVGEERKRSDSYYMRMSARDGSAYRPDEDNLKTKEERAITELRSQILSLTKKVFINQEEISRMKDKKEKDKKVQMIEQEFTQFQIQFFDICKKNTIYFSEFQDKIERNSRLIGEVQSRHPEASTKSIEKEQIMKRIHQCQAKITQLGETARAKEDFTIKNLASQLNMEETMMKKYVNQQISEVKSRIDKHTLDKSQVMTKIGKLEKDLVDKKFEDFFKRDVRKAESSITIQERETICIKRNEVIKDRTNKYVNQGRKSFGENSLQFGKDSSLPAKNELVVKESLYYIDPQGYLLDENKFYLLNSKNQQISLSPKLMHCLKENNILNTPSVGHSRKSQ